MKLEASPIDFRLKKRKSHKTLLDLTNLRIYSFFSIMRFISCLLVIISFSVRLITIRIHNIKNILLVINDVENGEHDCKNLKIIFDDKIFMRIIYG